MLFIAVTAEASSAPRAAQTGIADKVGKSSGAIAENEPQAAHLIRTGRIFQFSNRRAGDEAPEPDVSVGAVLDIDFPADNRHLPESGSGIVPEFGAFGVR